MSVWYDETKKTISDSADSEHKEFKNLKIDKNNVPYEKLSTAEKGNVSVSPRKLQKHVLVLCASNETTTKNNKSQKIINVLDPNKKYDYVFTYVGNRLTNNKDARIYNIELLDDFDVNYSLPNALANPTSILNKLRNMSDTKKYYIIINELCPMLSFNRFFEEYVPVLLDTDGKFIVPYAQFKEDKFAEKYKPKDVELNPLKLTTDDNKQYIVLENIHQLIQTQTAGAYNYSQYFTNKNIYLTLKRYLD